MSPLLADWALSFALTLIVEVPLFAALGRGLPAWRAAVVGAVGSCVTHPLLWFVWPRIVSDYTAFLVTGEVLVTLIEALIVVIALPDAGLRRALVMSCVANAASLGLGLVLRALGLL